MFPPPPPPPIDMIVICCIVNIGDIWGDNRDMYHFQVKQGNSVTRGQVQKLTPQFLLYRYIYWI